VGVELSVVDIEISFTNKSHEIPPLLYISLIYGGAKHVHLLSSKKLGIDCRSIKKGDEML
jgi:hypothetical protein